MTVNTGIDKSSQKEMGQALSRLLADTYLLYLKTQNFHWNVTGSNFHSLHLMFETQYKELAEAIDTIAERIRALGVKAPAAFSLYQSLATVKEEPGVPAADDMVKQLLNDHETLVRTTRSLLPLANDAEDEVTVTLLDDRMNVHEKTAWMLRATLGQD